MSTKAVQCADPPMPVCADPSAPRPPRRNEVLVKPPCLRSALLLMTQCGGHLVLQYDFMPPCITGCDRGWACAATGIVHSEASCYPAYVAVPSAVQPVGVGTAASAAQAVSGLVGGAAPAGPGGAPDPITSTLAGMSRKQLYDILSQMKGLINQNPAQVGCARSTPGMLLFSLCDADTKHPNCCVVGPGLAAL